MIWSCDPVDQSIDKPSKFNINGHSLLHWNEASRYLDDNLSPYSRYGPWMSWLSPTFWPEGITFQAYIKMQQVQGRNEKTTDKLCPRNINTPRRWPSWSWRIKLPCDVARGSSWSWTADTEFGGYIGCYGQSNKSFLISNNTHTPTGSFWTRLSTLRFTTSKN